MGQRMAVSKIEQNQPNVMMRLMAPTVPVVRQQMMAPTALVVPQRKSQVMQYR